MVSQKEKENTESRRKEQFSRIKKDCKNIPYWIPEPIQLKDFNIQRVVDLFNACKNVQETITCANQLQVEHYNIYKKEYEEHKEIHDSTLLAARKEWNSEKSKDFIKPRCCFNHYFGLAKKRDSNDYLPVFDYELHLVHNLDIRNFITYVASRGLGKTHTIIQRYTPHRILRSTEWDNQDVLLTTGLTQQNSTELLRKIEAMFQSAFPNLELNFRGTEMHIDQTRLIAFPSENIKKMRLYDRVAAIFVDEADFFNLNDQNRLQEAIFGYFIKSRPLVALFSTPDKPNGIMMRARKKWRERMEEKKENDIL